MDYSVIPREQFEAAERAIINGDAASLEQFLITFKNNPEVRQWYGSVGPYAIDEKDFLEDARSVIAEKHCFNSWSEYEKFKEELNRKDSSVAQFEKAVDAIANGDAETLKQLLQHNSGLLHARSIRRHHSTLLNYVGANGVEGFRQKTPKNAVEVAEILLNAGAEVDALGDMYRGTTTLGLVATSIHPVKTGVQKELIDIFLKYGADPNHAVAPDYTEGLLIVACLHNGRGEAAEYLAKKNATLDLEGAAGVGDLNKVRSYFNEDGSLKEGATKVQRDSGFMWACEYGRTGVVEFLLNHGVDISTESNGMTGLHWAVVGGQIDMVKLLLQRNAPLEIKNCYGGTVLSQALWSAFNESRAQYLTIIENLIAVGAKVKPEWNQYIDEVRRRYGFSQ